MRCDATLAILCGGLARRLGEDKGLYRPLGEESLVEIAWRLWGPAFSEVLVVLRDAAQKARYESHLRPQSGVRFVTDPDSSPAREPCALSGVAGALANAEKSQVVIVPVDQIGVRVSSLVRLLDGGNAPVCAFRNTETRYPFPSRWSRNCFGEVMERYRADQLSIKLALEFLGCHWLEAGPAEEELERNGNTHQSIEDYFGKALHGPL